MTTRWRGTESVHQSSVAVDWDLVPEGYDVQGPRLLPEVAGRGNFVWGHNEISARNACCSWFFFVRRVCSTLVPME